MSSDAFKPIDLSGIQTVSIAARKSIVSVDNFAKSWKKGSPFKEFIDSLPDILAGRDIKKVISAVVSAFKNGRTTVFGMGAHVIKVGLNPIVIDLMERNILSAIALNGAGIIHDLEIALTGRTSEDVSASLEDGSFGMAKETCQLITQAIRKTGKEPVGLGQAVGQIILENDLVHREESILAAGVRLDIPVTVHVAFGTDIIHMHPEFDPKLAGSATHRDFRTFAAIVATLEKGVYVNIGSAVILPEVFLKALTLARNLGHPVQNLTTVNMDFIRQYRPLANVVDRPTAKGGTGINLVGHHEIMLPLIAAGIIEDLGQKTG